MTTDSSVSAGAKLAWGDPAHSSRPDRLRRSGGNTRPRALAWYLVVGVGLQILGGIIIGASWPGPEVVQAHTLSDTSSVEQTGSVIGVILGALVAWVGALLLFIWIIAFAVRLGTAHLTAVESR
jgi:hypothetical protein